MNLSSISSSKIIQGTFSVVFASASANIAKQIYDISLGVLKNELECPKFDLSSLTCGMIASGVLSFNIAQAMWQNKTISVQPSPRYLRPLKVSQTEIVAFSPGEGENFPGRPPKGASQ